MCIYRLSLFFAPIPLYTQTKWHREIMSIDEQQVRLDKVMQNSLKQKPDALDFSMFFFVRLNQVWKSLRKIFHFSHFFFSSYTFFHRWEIFVICEMLIFARFYTIQPFGFWDSWDSSSGKMYFLTALNAVRWINLVNERCQCRIYWFQGMYGQSCKCQ